MYFMNHCRQCTATWSVMSEDLDLMFLLLMGPEAASRVYFAWFTNDTMKYTIFKKKNGVSWGLPSEEDRRVLKDSNSRTPVPNPMMLTTLSPSGSLRAFRCFLYCYFVPWSGLPSGWKWQIVYRECHGIDAVASSSGHNRKRSSCCSQLRWIKIESSSILREHLNSSLDFLSHRLGFRNCYWRLWMKIHNRRRRVS